ncbi:MAG TPA: TOMM precursor leader peptide-binding protein [Candidatus Kapabacteria bacterium]|nr:TOMM precursor leader peptide-binding protein [Candidatus Kapabacteria bacterium]
MLKNPRLKYSYHAEFLDDQNVLLVSEKNSAILTGKQYKLVLSEIHSSGLPVDELAAKLGNKLSTIEIYYTLALLERDGYLTESVPSMPQETAAFWENQGIEINSLLKVLEEKTLRVETIGLPKQGFFIEAFNTVGIKTNEDGVLKVIITDDYEREELRQINREAMETKQPWMLVRPVGVELWLGPIFIPGKTGCWECLKQRLAINSPINTFYRTQKNTRDNLHIPASHLPLSIQIAAGQAAIEMVKWLYYGKNELLEGKIVSYDTHSLTCKSHILVKRPQCKTCGEPGFNHLEPKPIVLEKKSTYCVTAMGGYREVPPENTIEKYQHHVSPITGVVQSLKPYFSEKDTPVYNYASGRNIAMRSKTLFWLNQHIRTGNGGKGKNWSQAKAGALCEAIERYSSVYHGEEPYIIGSLKELGSKGIHPNACMNYSEKQYQNREASNHACSKFYALVPVPFDESLEMHWTPVYSLTGQSFKYLPSCFCYAQYPAKDEWNLFAYPDSNGGAAGNSIEEAILQGFLELVERDSVAIWWYNMLRKPGVDLTSFNEPYFLQLIEYYRSKNRSLYVLDLTADLQIPVFGAISHRLDDKRQDIIFAFGAHVDAKIAVERALIELNQILPIVNVAESDRFLGKYRIQDKSFVDWLKTAAMENSPYLVPLENMPMKTASDYRRLCEPNIYDSLFFCINAAAKHGLETMVVDMTRPDVGLNVVKVIVPGLRHFWKRLAPGRLYDIPVKMGWLKRSLKEEELNAVALFI